MKPTSDIVIGAIQFALNDRATSNEIRHRDEDPHLYSQSITATVIDFPAHPNKYAIKISFDYSPPQPGKEDIAVWIGFDYDGNYIFLEGRRQ